LSHLDSYNYDKVEDKFFEIISSFSSKLLKAATNLEKEAALELSSKLKKKIDQLLGSTIANLQNYRDSEYAYRVTKKGEKSKC